MPTRAPRVCGCGERVPFGLFCKCQLEAKRERDARAEANRLPASLRGYNSKWRQERDRFLRRAENQLCACGCGRRATVVDHIKPHRGDWKVFWDRNNWQPLAATCHSRKKQAQEARDDD